MSSIPRPPLMYDDTTLSSLVKQTTVFQEQSVYLTLPLSRRQTAPARAHGWNRQSILLFADFNKFESPRGSREQQRADQEDDSDYGSPLNWASTERNFSSASIDSLEKKLPEPPYHVFSLAKKKQLVYIISLAGLFSPLSSNIYFPALGQISKVRIILMFLYRSLTGHRISSSACL
jgi:hypothetical protein